MSSQSTLTAQEKVYGNEMLREMIIKHFIFDEENQPSPNLSVARLVNKTWLECTSKLLADSPPLFELEIGYDTTLKMLCPLDEDGDFMSNSDLACFVSPNHLSISVLPFRLKMTKDCFREQNYNFFYHLLRTWGHNLNELYIMFPKCGGTMIFTFPTVTLPILDKVTFVWSKEKLTMFDGENQNIFGNKNNSLYFLQYLLNLAPSLEQLVLTVTNDIETSVQYPPKGIEFLHLPPTIACLELNCILTAKQLGTLTRNPLPDLQKLVVQSDELFRERNLTSEVLQKFQSSLEYLEFFGLIVGKLVENLKTFIQLPSLPKVKTLWVNCNDFELETGQLNLQQSLPVLKGLSLLWQTQEMLLKWIENSKFRNVSNLELSVVNLDNNDDDNDEEFECGDDQDELFVIDVDEVLMSKIILAFPNVTVLRLHIPCNANAGLHLLFCEMTQLQELSIYCPWCTVNKSADDWTSTLLGMPVQLVVGLKAAPYSWTSLDLQTLSLNGVNIAKLQALTALSLESFSLKEAIEDADSWLSDMVFHMAIMKMPNLTSLNFTGNFKPSDLLIAAWEARPSRKISYSLEN